jgi:hypothetical protein
MQVNRNELIGIIKNLNPGLANKEIIEQSTHVIFYKTAICSYNDEIFVGIPFDCGFAGTVDANLLLKIISKYEEEQIKLDINPQGNKLDVYGDMNSASLSLVTDSPIFKHLDEILATCYGVKDWKALPKDFQVGIEMCAFSASRDRTLGAMCCLRIEGEDILSTDKYRIGWYVMDQGMGKFLLEADHALEISRYKLLNRYSLANGWANFKSDNGMFMSCRIVEPPAEEMDLRTFFSVSEDAARMKLPSDLIKRAELAGVLSEGATAIERQVNLIFSGDEVVCKSKSEKGEIESRSKLEKPAPFPVSVEISPDLLIEILKFVSSTVIFQKIDEDRGKAIFRTRGFSHVIMVRLA